jgi:hypothetical protein
VPGLRVLLLAAAMLTAVATSALDIRAEATHAESAGESRCEQLVKVMERSEQLILRGALVYIFLAGVYRFLQKHDDDDGPPTYA